MTWEWSIDGWIVLVGVLSACSCALVGNFLVLRKLSLMGDAISHAVLPGLAVAFLITASRSSGPMLFGAVVVGVLTALLTQVIARYGKVEHGAAMGVVFSVLFAIGLVLIRQAADKVDLDPQCVLYGDVLNIAMDASLSGGDETSAGGLWGWVATLVHAPPLVHRLLFVLALNVLFIALFYKELKICAFDPALATTLGINANVMHYLLMIVVAVTTVANFEAVGSILVIAMLIVPAATAHLLTDRLGRMIVLSAIVAAASGAGGHVLAIYGPRWVGLGSDMTVSTAPMMAVTTGGFLIVALLLSPEYGLISRLWRRAALSLQIVREDILGLLFRWQEMQHDAPMPRHELVRAVGGGWHFRQAMNILRRRRQIEFAPAGDSGVGVRLSKSGVADASQLIRAHRLWETYLAKHFQLPEDHLHMPAERMEHHITPTLQERLQEHLADPSHDPQGKAIPDPDSRETS